jgi:hypothetical protein
MFDSKCRLQKSNALDFRRDGWKGSWLGCPPMVSQCGVVGDGVVDGGGWMIPPVGPCFHSDQLYPSQPLDETRVYDNQPKYSYLTNAQFPRHAI